MINCVHPVLVPVKSPDGTVRKVYVPCGHCMLCLNKRVNEWRFRLEQELKFSRIACFMTFTLDDDHIYEAQKDPKRYFQLFIKRLRKNNPFLTKSSGFKYFCASELGSNTGRLHYHVLFFNFGISYSDFVKECERSWNSGFVDFEYVGNRISYIVKYMLNGAFTSRGRHVCDFVGLDSLGRKVFNRRYIKPFSWYFTLKSQGFGYCMLTDRMCDYLESSHGTVTVSSKNGVRVISIPRALYNRLLVLRPQLNDHKNERFSKMVENSCSYSQCINYRNQCDSGNYVERKDGLVNPDNGEFLYPVPDSYGDFLNLQHKNDSLYSFMFTKLKYKYPPLCRSLIPLKYQSHVAVHSI